MAFELKPNSGVLFKNKDKQEATHADYNGEILVDGVSYWLNGWIKTSKKTGEKFLTVSVKPKGQKQSTKHPDVADEDIPF